MPADAAVIAEFFGQTLGAMFAFIIHVFTEIELWGVSLLHVLYIMIAFSMVMLFIKVLIK